ncbi:MAG: aminotransferase class V-fold PLP-dependent enzyme [Spirochaetota bacterium]|jgi:cysteine desulfurase/selenocysteine lyase|nr:aminotransferase class V-fold PLP-dependent enzyme [Spirochaetota bacterium]
MTSFDPYILRKEFPYFAHESAVWLDNAANTQKPQAVLDRVLLSLARASTVHRAVYALAEEATLVYEEARSILARFISAPSKDEVIFTNGTTGAINLFARSLYLSGKRAGRQGFRIVTSVLEHHSNYLPWRMLADEPGVEIIIIGHDGLGIDMEALAKALSAPCDLVALSLCSNVSGAWLDSQQAAKLARAAGAVLFLDAAQAVLHRAICLDDSVALPAGGIRVAADALAFSGHKMYGPDGTGALWVRGDLLQDLVPVTFGGEMVRSVDDSAIDLQPPPRRFEAGTPNCSAILGFAEAARWLLQSPRDEFRAHEEGLGRMLHDELSALPGARLYSVPGPLISFTLDGWHTHDLALFLDREGLCLRAGRLCAEPFMRALGVPALVRASLAAYTTREDCMRLVRALTLAKAAIPGRACLARFARDSASMH